MGSEKEKKGLFGLFSGKKAKKGSCCCGGFEVEELPEKEEKEEKEKKKRKRRAKIIKTNLAVN